MEQALPAEQSLKYSKIYGMYRESKFTPAKQWTERVYSAFEIKQAMNTLRLDNWTDELLDEIELNRKLKHSLEQADRGETFPIDELKKQVMEKFANGYYDR